MIPKIVKDREICNGRPVIAGTRIKVSQIALEFGHLGMTPDSIVEAHPHLNLAQVHAALAYYYQHVDEIKEEIKINREYIEQIKKRFVSKIGRLEYA